MMIEPYSKLHEECAVFGAYDLSKRDCASDAYDALFSMQHRGQESCGIAASQDREFTFYKDSGLVSEVFVEKNLDRVHGEIVVGHVRYSTSGGTSVVNAQPLVTRYVKGMLAFAHNGNISNSTQLREKLENDGAIFQTNVDSEVIAYLIAKERTRSKSIEEAVSNALPKLEGAYSLLVMSPRKLIAARDPHGYRPLSIGRKGDTYYFVSETCALDILGAEFIRDVKPGEIVMVDENGLRTVSCNDGGKKGICIFEYIYFARSDSVIEGRSVYEARVKTGELLAKQHPVDADIVIGVPDSGIDAAIGYSIGSGIPYSKAFVKSNYVGRTFIQPTQSRRERAVFLKLMPIKANVRGKRIVMIDDSIVRGTTCAQIVKHLKDECGAKEVHVRIASPKFLWPCYFGTDIPNRDVLIAVHKTTEEICEMLNADSLDFLDVDNLKHIVGENIDFCDACFTGNYISPVHHAPEGEGTIKIF